MLKNDQFPKVKWLHPTGEMDKSVRCSCQILSGFNIPKLLNSVNVLQSYSKNKKVDVFGTLEPFEFDGYAFNMLEQ